ncbi:hypothetical protein BJ508DRAFT_323334 [Ascobolus immersus RN42]|uniref:Uncharacterized protein n=1 Tax=Ascobolus immersus RN42 TaxID=1160509 RepID=A0A3N4IGM4_ASCIM|nr:hypothetical protein BJ508DRAFT_323334 [Ascobolus immersus RN42]
MQNHNRPSSVNIWVQTGRTTGSGHYQAVNPSQPATLGVAHPYGVNPADIPAGQAYISPVIPAENAPALQRQTHACGNRILVRRLTACLSFVRLLEVIPCSLCSGSGRHWQRPADFLCECCHFAACGTCLERGFRRELGEIEYVELRNDWDEELVYKAIFETYSHAQGPRGEEYCTSVLERTVQSVRAST